MDEPKRLSERVECGELSAEIAALENEVKRLKGENARLRRKLEITAVKGGRNR